MPELSVQNIEQISRDIRRQEITFSHLLDELVDHVCCDVENEMLAGLTFSEAYEKVKLKFSPDCFRDIQKDTLYAVDFKYRNMRNTMKVSGITGTILFGFAALFKIQHWPLAGVMMTVGAFVLAFVFLPSSLGVLWKETHNRKRVFLFVAAFLTGASFIAGTLFKVQHWPGAGIVLVASLFSAIFLLFPALLVMVFSDSENKRFRPVALAGAAGAIIFLTGMLFKMQHWPLATILVFVGIVILGFISLPWYTRMKWKNEETISPRFIFLLVACLAVIVPGALVNLNLQHTYEEGYYINQERQNSFYDYMYRNNASLISELSGSPASDKALKIHSQTISLINEIDEIRKKMVQQAEGEPGNPALSDDKLITTASGLTIDFKQLASPFQPDPVKEYLNAGNNSRNELNRMLTEYAASLKDVLPLNYSTAFEVILEPSGFLAPHAEPGEQVSLMSALHSLGLLRNTILVAESASLTTLKSNENQINASK